MSFGGFAAQVYADLLGSIPMPFRVVIINAYGMVLAASGRIDLTRQRERLHLDLGKYVLEDPRRAGKPFRSKTVTVSGMLLDA